MSILAATLTLPGMIPSTIVPNSQPKSNFLSRL